MKKGFFSSQAVSTKRPLPLLARCGECRLYRSCQSPKMQPHGKGKKGILLLGEAPGKDEDEQGRPFVGVSGQLLREALRKFDVDVDRDCWATNAAICRPKNNALPDKAVEWCRPNLVKTVGDLKPKAIIALGGSAVESVIGWVWKEDVGLVSRWTGLQVPCQKINAWICPTWHPSYILRSRGSKEEGVLKLLFEKHLKEAVALVDEFDSFQGGENIQIMTDTHATAYRLRDFENESKEMAFDYETNMLKPDGEKARIVSCSVSNGEWTMAFPWHGPVIKEMQKLLQSGIPKIASNLKFEERWTWREFGHGVNNWHWDTMLAAHAIDNRPGVTSIKFQAFTMLGADSWDEAVAPYLKAKGSNEENRIKECDLHQLLTYNAMDSLMEFHVAQRQKEILT